MINIELLSYNNFYNNIAKKEGSLSTDYSTYKVSGPFTVDFNPNDGIDTELVLNITDTNNADYLITYDPTSKTIANRWFIMERKRLRGGQCKLTLHRDVIIDNIGAIKNSTALIERATLLDNDPFIFNKEPSSYNQIKMGEEELRDFTNTPWIVGYLANTLDTEPKTITYSPSGDQYYASFASWDDFEFKDNVSGVTGITPTDFHLATSFIVDFNPLTREIPSTYDNVQCQNLSSNPLRGIERKAAVPSDYYRYKYNENFNYNNQTEVNRAGLAMANFLQRKHYVDNNLYDGTIFDHIKHNAYNDYNIYVPDEDTIRRYESYNNKIIKVGPSGSEKLYKLQIASGYVDDNTPRYIYSTSNDWKRKTLETIDASLTSSIEALGVFYTRVPVPVGGIYFHTRYKRSLLVATEINSSNTYSLTIPGTRKKLQDAPYTMFAIPYNKVKVSDGLLGGFTSDEIGCRGIASAMATALGGTGTTYIYDLQLLPYCPVQTQGLIVNGDEFRPTNIKLALDKDFSKITKTTGGVTSTVGFVFWLEYSSFSVSIGKTISVDNIKLSNETDLYRICSPNYQGTFDFSAAKNRGVSGFDVDCTYRPYTPYIKIAPIWNQEGIYGGTNDDGRGCICGGDFSLPIVDNAWIDYQITNKNFLNIFDRQIKSMDTMHGYDKIERITSSIGSALGTGFSGGAAGALMRGTPLGIGLGITGAVLSAAGGIADYVIAEKRFDEQKSLTKDMFNYQNGNVQAIPDSLAKVGCQTSNFRFWPMLEYYSCTDEEKENLDLLLKTQGMTVGKVNLINDYFDTVNRFTFENDKQFIRGRIIKSEISDDSHMLISVNNQLSAGVYFTKELIN